MLLFFQELAVRQQWVMANKPVEWQYDTWFPTDWLSANLRHNISVIFSESSAGESGSADAQGEPGGNGDEVVQSMEVDPMSDGKNSFGSIFLPSFPLRVNHLVFLPFLTIDDSSDSRFSSQTPSGITMEEGNRGSGTAGPSISTAIEFTQRMAITDGGGNR